MIIISLTMWMFAQRCSIYSRVLINSLDFKWALRSRKYVSSSLSVVKAKFHEWHTRCIARDRRYNGPRSAFRAPIDVKFRISAGD